MLSTTVKVKCQGVWSNLGRVRFCALILDFDE